VNWSFTSLQTNYAILNTCLMTSISHLHNSKVKKTYSSFNVDAPQQCLRSLSLLLFYAISLNNVVEVSQYSDANSYLKLIWPSWLASKSPKCKCRLFKGRANRTDKITYGRHVYCVPYQWACQALSIDMIDEMHLSSEPSSVRMCSERHLGLFLGSLLYIAIFK